MLLIEIYEAFYLTYRKYFVFTENPRQNKTTLMACTLDCERFVLDMKCEKINTETIAFKARRRFLLPHKCNLRESRKGSARSNRGNKKNWKKRRRY